MENKKYSLTVSIDNDPQNPREWDNISKIYCQHKRYNLPQEIKIDNTYCNSWEDVIEEIDKTLKEQGDEIIHPKNIYMLDHSGLWVSLRDFNDKWDSGQIGFIFTTKKTIEKEGIKEKDIEKAIENEFEDWKAYIEGNIYSYVIEKKVKCNCCNNIDYEYIDSLSGIIANDMEDIKEAIEGNTDKETLKGIKDLLNNIKEIEVKY
jgi:hypothetical protein